MSSSFQAVQISDNVYWVGAIDWEVRSFHGYLTSRGSTYNAYLVIADKITLIDTVKKPFMGEMMARIASVVDPASIEYIVSNHSEMDHTGSLPEALKTIKPSKVFASKMGVKALVNHFHFDQELTIVGDGDSVDIGGKTLAFVETRMCHWPDSMVTYLAEDELLFSQDAFGMHLASYERFADELPDDVLNYEAAKYYANILLHLSPFIDKTLNKMQGLNLPLKMIAPDHGPIWRGQQDIDRIIGDYARWSAQKPTDKAIVLYDSMWDSTAAMAGAIGEGLSSEGMHVKLMSMRSSHRSDVVTELLEAGALVVGSPTMNNSIYPTLADVMTYLKGLKPRNLVAAAFGSYGWSGEAAKQLNAMLLEMQLDVVADPLRVMYVPDEQALARCHELGVTVARATRNQIEGESIETMLHPKPVHVDMPPGCNIDVNDGQKQIETATGQSLFHALQAENITLPTICGGQGMCGCCKVTVLQGGSKPTSEEKGHLSELQLDAGLRLACQVQLEGDMAIRVPVEALDAKPFTGTIEAITDMTYDIKHIRIRLDRPAEMVFTPGQYIKFDVPDTVYPGMISRAFSIANPTSDNTHIELIVRLSPDGICTNWMFSRMATGEKITLSGPFGDFGLSDSDSEMIWIAGGSGMSTFWSILRDMADKGIERNCTMFFGAVSKRDLYLVDELSQYAKDHHWFTYVPALSSPTDDDNWTGETGLITNVVDRHVEDGKNLEAYLCGSPGMIAAAHGILEVKHISEDRIFYDEFTPPQ